MGLEHNTNLEYIDTEKNTDELLNNLEFKTEEALALGIVKQLDKQLKEGYDIDFAIDRKKNQYYIIVNDNILNLPLDINSLEKFGNDVVNLLNYDGKIQLIGGEDWRAIAEVQWLGGSAGAKKIVDNPLKYGKNLAYYVYENNKTEELFKFIQLLKKVPESDWKIDPSILKSGPIGIGSK
ncbi:MAG: hypothetical protein PHH06_04775 [Candidatus Gracilibacteria bacterium]|nr:hypothetical protein [Candidatus Gracilibacteria bacterium]